MVIFFTFQLRFFIRIFLPVVSSLVFFYYYYYEIACLQPSHFSIPIGSKNISHTQAEEIISVLHDTYDYNTEQFSNLLREASDKSDFSDEYDDVIFQMHLILSTCINSIVKKEKGYILTVSSYIKAFHNLPRAFLSITDKSRISPAEAIDYSKSYLKLN